jgi:hypothetical protein
MTLFSYSCVSFGCPVIGPAMRTIFFGFSALSAAATGRHSRQMHVRRRTADAGEQGHKG